MSNVISNKPSIVANKLLKEVVYGFVAFLIAYLFNIAFDAITASDYAYLIPIIDAVEHVIIKAFEKYNTEYSKTFIPFYVKIKDALVEGAGKVVEKFKKTT